KGSDHGEHEILAQNLTAMATIYRKAGVRRLVLAGSVEDAAIENIGPIRQTALRVLEVAGWFPAGTVKEPRHID
ncbi:MAG TPA: hypothetical protein VK736_04340, partial [Candidatus Binatia bacterium]|nr:hypothetical protein [Candidatus Binatia bacterium]